MRLTAQLTYAALFFGFLGGGSIIFLLSAAITQAARGL